MSSTGKFLPREGLYIDPIASAIKRYFLNPLISIPLFVATLIPGIVSSVGILPNQAAYLLPTTRFLAFFSVLIHGNEYLSRSAKNNYVHDPIWQGSWSQELVLITGAASPSGIGSSIVRGLLASQRKIKIIVLDVVPMGYEPGPNVVFYKCDLSDAKAIARVCATIRMEHGHPTVLINNAGVARGRTVAGGSYHDKDLTIRTNLLAPFFLMQEVLQHMIEQDHGHILSISSMSAHVSPAGAADYAASKAGLLALHDSLSLELSQKAPKIRLSLLVASFIHTNMTESFKSSLGKAPFAAPVLHVDTVGDAIVDTLFSGYGRDMYLPGLMRYVAGIRGWPMWLQCRIRDGLPRILLDLEEEIKLRRD